MSIQYAALGFEPTISPPITTRPGLLILWALGEHPEPVKLEAPTFPLVQTVHIL